MKGIFLYWVGDQGKVKAKQGTDQPQGSKLMDAFPDGGTAASGKGSLLEMPGAYNARRWWWGLWSRRAGKLERKEGAMVKAPALDMGDLASAPCLATDVLHNHGRVT